jgi:hypothetical protein
MIAAGVNIKAISTFMRHKSVTTTIDRYGHLIPGSEDEAAALLDAYLELANTQARMAQVEDPPNGSGAYEDPAMDAGKAASVDESPLP